MSERIKKLNDLLRDEVGKIILRENIAPEGVLITVLRAVISVTLEHATIYISVLPEDRSKEMLKKLKFKIYDIQQQLNKKLKIRTVPKIRFEIDTAELRAQHIEELLQKVGEK
ncbi:MAG: 30S ribosome-binding factor RbfA [Minisyncoccia bacterium]